MPFWKIGDKISYYITGGEANTKGFENCKLAEQWDVNFPDENSAYYLRRLDEFASKFEMFFTPSDFRAIFSLEDLFGFDPNGIRITTQPVKSVPEEKDEEADDFA